MKIRELIRYSEKLLKGKRTHILAVCMLPLCASLLFRLLEIAVFSLILYLTDISPSQLFKGNSPVILVTAIVLMITRRILKAPLQYASAYRLTELCSEEKSSFTPLWSVISGKKTFSRSMGAMFLTSLIELFFAVMVVIPLAAAYYFLVSGNAFNIIHTLAVSLAFLLIYFAVKLDFLAVPYLTAYYRDKNIVSVVFGAFKFMRGRKFTFLRLIFMYGISFLMIIPFPFFFPEFRTAFSLCISIFLREDEYLERNKIQSRTFRTDDTRKISYSRKRRVKTAADEIKATG